MALRLLIASLALCAGMTSLVTVAEEQPQPSVSVSGSADLRLAPDMARVSMTASHRADSVAAAQQVVAETVNSVLKIAQDLGVEKTHINTTSASASPRYRWNEKEERQQLVGYEVSRDITIELLDLAKLGTLLEQAGEAGVSGMSPPVLDASEREAVHRQALKLAFANAQANAEVLAAAAGADLGRAQSITSSGSRPPAVPRMRAAAMEMADASATSFNAADLTVRAQVSVIFALDY